MVRGVRASLSDNFMRETLCTLHNIVCSAHSPVQSRLVFMGAEGFKTPCVRVLSLRGTLWLHLYNVVQSVCVCVCLHVCRLMTTGNKRCHRLVFYTNNALGWKHDSRCPLLLPLSLSLHHRLLLLTCATSLMIVQRLRVHHASFTRAPEAA